MITGRLFISRTGVHGQVERVVDLDEDHIEWILNALRTAQVGQLHLAREAALRGDTGTSKLDGPVDERYVSIVEMANESHAVITQLREEIVAAVGHDLTDG